jgi:hypothetical protein
MAVVKTNPRVEHVAWNWNWRFTVNDYRGFNMPFAGGYGKREAG